MCLWEDGEEWIEWIRKAHMHKCVCVCMCVCVCVCVEAQQVSQSKKFFG